MQGRDYFGRGSSWNAIVDVSTVAIRSGNSLGRGARTELDGVNGQLRAREEEKRSHEVIRRLLNEAGSSTIFALIVMSACGAMGPSMVAFIEVVTAASIEAFVEHDGGLVFFGRASEHAMQRTRGSKTAASFTATQHSQPPRHGAPTLTPTMRHTRRRASSPLPEGV